MVNPDQIPTRSKLNVEIAGANIFVGDIVKLRRDEVAPCDMLILTTGEELNGVQICRVDTFIDDGKMIRQVKEAVSLTKSFANLAVDDTRLKDYLKRLYARVDYTRQNSEIKGSFKLKADPRVENFDNTMVIFKGSILKSEFLIGLVLYNGKNCLGNTTRSNLLLFKTSSIQRKVTMFTIVTIVINLIACVLLTLAHERLREYTDRAQDPDLDYAGFLGFISLFFSVMPLSINIFLNCFFFISASVLQNHYRDYSAKDDYKKFTKLSSIVSNPELSRQTTVFQDKNMPDAGKQRKDTFRVLNPEVVSDLGEIDDAFFDKTGTLTLNKYEVKTITTRTRSYESKETPFCLNDAVIARYNLDERSPDEMVTPIKKFQTFGESDKESKGLIKNKFVSHKPSSTSKKSGQIEINKLDFRTGKLDKLPFDDGLPLETEHMPFKLDSDSDNNSPKPATPMKIGGVVTTGTAAIDKMYDESCFFSDLYYLDELAQLITLFTLCHNSKLKVNK